MGRRNLFAARGARRGLLGALGRPGRAGGLGLPALLGGVAALFLFAAPSVSKAPPTPAPEPPEPEPLERVRRALPEPSAVPLHVHRLEREPARK